MNLLTVLRALPQSGLKWTLFPPVNYLMLDVLQPHPVAQLEISRLTYWLQILQHTTFTTYHML